MAISLENIAKAAKASLYKPVPRHVAIIMDGNRRWAVKKGFPVQMGHWRGAESIDRVVEAAKELGIKILTLFAFSTENWNRSEQELNALMDLFFFFLKEKKL